MAKRDEPLMEPNAVAAVAGRRPDISAREGQFPVGEVPRVAREIHHLLASMSVRTVVCSAAAGADLLALRAARDLGLRQLVVLPFPPDRFRESSVADRGRDWAALFDDIIADLGLHGELYVLSEKGDEECAYRRANREILHRARIEAQTSKTLMAPIAIAAWDGTARPSGDLTADFIEEARYQGYRVVEVLTTRAAGRA